MSKVRGHAQGMNACIMPEAKNSAMAANAVPPNRLSGRVGARPDLPADGYQAALRR
ncbi:hypothetical protein OOJ09_26420 [Mesorhizobium qingshengii]|uniref:Uncharacterized protein n=1 Tax=Mesorhizobium qingshengii TaxID=1165689 RepID=A0ABT4R1M6_9HYPH|nr:hypothetical protein [Mesorhizobium qingshengii]MCZ8547737.1 hypothetical protein [Mesorhizobium qingshengii]